MTSYTRQSTFIPGDVIKAEHGNDEFNQLVSFAAQATGHKHDGTAGEGAYVSVISDTSNTDKVEIVTGGAKTTGTHQVTGLLTADASVAITGNITVTGTVDARDVATDGTKLDGIETAATADQIASEVVSTPAGDLAATDVQAALNELDTEKAALAGAAFTGAITTTSTFDGRDVATDGTKLDGIETSATADQTDVEIKTAYENNADTNAYTDAEQTKLAGLTTATTTVSGTVELATQAEVETGTDSTRAVTANTLPFNKLFTSSEQTISAAGGLTIAHSLGAEPLLMQAHMVCKTAEFNYSIGDKVYTNNGTNANRGFSVSFDSTNLTIRFDDAAVPMRIKDKTTGNEEDATNANWKIVFKAWV